MPQFFSFPLKDDDVPEKGEKNMNTGNIDSSCSSLLFDGQLEGRDHGNEGKELTNCNAKSDSFKTYHNKRYKIQQNGKVLTRLKLKDDLSSGTVLLREDIGQHDQTVDQELLSAKNQLVSLGNLNLFCCTSLQNVILLVHCKGYQHKS